MTLYQLPLSPWFLQIVTCRTPIRILCAGCDIVISFSFSFRPRPSRPYGTAIKAASVRGRAQASRTGQAKGRRLPLAESGLGSLNGTDGGFKRSRRKAVV